MERLCKRKGGKKELKNGMGECEAKAKKMEECEAKKSPSFQSIRKAVTGSISAAFHNHKQRKQFQEFDGFKCSSSATAAVSEDKQLQSEQQEVMPPENNGTAVVDRLLNDLNNESAATAAAAAGPITWYPAAEFLRMQDDLALDLAYSFALPPSVVDPVTTDGPAFSQIVEELLRQMNAHIARASSMLSRNEKIPFLGDGVEELLLVAVGRTNLLINKRMKQFQEQLDRHLKPLPGYKLTLLNDLHGLWALIDMQLDDIRVCFDNIEKCRRNQWVRTADINF